MCRSHGGCRKFNLSGGIPTSKPRIRRGVTTRFLLVRHRADQYKSLIQPSQGTISNKNSGWDETNSRCPSGGCPGTWFFPRPRHSGT